MRPRTEWSGAFLAALAMLGVGCVDGLRPGNATLRDYTGLDGCGWVIEADAGAVLEPLNLSEFISAPVPGMRLRVEYEEESDYFSICMVGPMVTLLACESLD